jgi:hypothetical protein
MNVVPVSNQSEDEQHKRDQQQTRGFRRVNRMPVVLVLRVVLCRRGHAVIVALEGRVVTQSFKGW